MNKEPTATAAVRFPTEYGETGSDLLPWSYVEERLLSAPNYWITTVTGTGRPHARPVDGVWVDGTLCFGGSPETRWVRNLSANPAISVHLASNAEAIILEGTVEQITDADHPLTAASTAASREKYPQYYTDTNESGPPPVPFWTLRPSRAYAWSLEGFPKRATRWTFDRG